MRAGLLHGPVLQQVGLQRCRPVAPARPPARPPAGCARTRSSACTPRHGWGTSGARAGLQPPRRRPRCCRPSPRLRRPAAAAPPAGAAGTAGGCGCARCRGSLLSTNTWWSNTWAGGWCLGAHTHRRGAGTPTPYMRSSTGSSLSCPHPLLLPRPRPAPRRGSSGRVFLCMSLDDHRLYAVKVGRQKACGPWNATGKGNIL